MSDNTERDIPSTTEDPARTALDVATDFALDAAIPAPIRKNALKAFDRLCSALIDVPVGALERRSAEKRAESESRIKIEQEITAQIIQQIQVDPEYALKAGHKFAEKILREQLNLDKISAIAANELKNREPDSLKNQGASGPNEGQSTDSPNQGTDSHEERVIDDDWLNNFETQARQVSTEEMQLRFGRVLAGEIEKPGSYSIRTIKTLGELDQKTATLFKKLCSLCVVLESPTGGPIIDCRVPSLGLSLQRNELRKYGLAYSDLNQLNEYGLIISEYDSWFYDYILCVAGTDSNKPKLPFKHQGRYWGLFTGTELAGNEVFSLLLGVALSGAGRELFRIVDQDSTPQYTEDLMEYFTIQGLGMVEMPVQ